jgi:hypothetical protein
MQIRRRIGTLVLPRPRGFTDRVARGHGPEVGSPAPALVHRCRRRPRPHSLGLSRARAGSPPVLSTGTWSRKVLPRTGSPSFASSTYRMTWVLPRTHGFTGCAHGPSSIARFFRARAGSPRVKLMQWLCRLVPSAHARVHRQSLADTRKGLWFFRGRAGSPPLAWPWTAFSAALPRTRGFTGDAGMMKLPRISFPAHPRVHPPDRRAGDVRLGDSFASARVQRSSR